MPKEIKVACIARTEFIPSYESSGAAGADLRADISGELILLPGERQIIPTGLRLQIPEGFEAQIRPRSGLASKHGVTLLNAPGTIDSDYRGEVKVILINLSDRAYTVRSGVRIAQIVFAPVLKVEFAIQETIEQSGRGHGGFGSTGA